MRPRGLVGTRCYGCITYVRKSLFLVREREVILVKAVLVSLASARRTYRTVVHKVESSLATRGTSQALEHLLVSVLVIFVDIPAPIQYACVVVVARHACVNVGGTMVKMKWCGIATATLKQGVHSAMRKHGVLRAVYKAWWACVSLYPFWCQCSRNAFIRVDLPVPLRGM